MLKKNSKYSFFLKIIQNAITKTESRIIRDFMELGDLQVSIKGTNDFVTNADKRSEEIIYNEISKKTRGMDVSFLMEESGLIGNKNAEFCFIIDPIDGTFNFMHGISYFCTSVAMMHNQNGISQIVAGIIHSPITRETFTAEKNIGAFYIDLNTTIHKITTSAKKNLRHSMIATSVSSDSIRHHQLIQRLIKNNARIRSMGSSALDLAYLALGRYEAVISPCLHQWDYAMGFLLVLEAGGIVNEHQRSEAPNTNEILATNSKEIYNAIKNLEDKDKNLS
ncbi:inositol monophosphatase [Candidatus Xenohaliotis californiensis]